MYNLLLLWKHPYEDTIVQESMNHVLHPNTSLSVSIEYPNLLVHFLEKLYDSYTGINEVIRDYNGYENEEMIPIIQDLSEHGKLILIRLLNIKSQFNLYLYKYIRDKGIFYYSLYCGIVKKQFNETPRR